MGFFSFVISDIIVVPDDISEAEGALKFLEMFTSPGNVWKAMERMGQNE